MSVYNTVVTVICNIEADSPEGAISMFTNAVRRAGFEVYENPGQSPHAFEAEDGTEAQRIPSVPAGRWMNPYW